MIAIAIDDISKYLLVSSEEIPYRHVISQALQEFHSSPLL
jgi:hypothetical protein